MHEGINSSTKKKIIFLVADMILRTHANANNVISPLTRLISMAKYKNKQNEKYRSL